MCTAMESKRTIVEDMGRGIQSKPIIQTVQDTVTYHIISNISADVSLPQNNRKDKFKYEKD